LRTALAVSVALAQIGEFSFILAALGRDLGVLPPEALHVIVAVAIVSIVLNPVAYRTLAPIDRWASRQAWLRRFVTPDAGGQSPRPLAPAVPDTHRAIIVGFGPTGRTLTRLLQTNGLAPTVIELNMDTVRRLRADGVPAVYGDASHRDVLDAAGVMAARELMITADVPNIREVIRLARELNPAIRVLARTSHLRDVNALVEAGADEVFSGEGEVALALTEVVLGRLGATAEQIDRERDRVHAELLGG
jgi:CPA2 family monovalent cation:H+ antiporter-2